MFSQQEVSQFLFYIIFLLGSCANIIVHPFCRRFSFVLFTWVSSRIHLNKFFSI